jgi:DNA-binding response OmpR family regulator
VRLLVAEDDAKLCEVLIRGLRSAGYSVDGATRGDEAVDLLMSHAYDAAVVDWRMPAMDGIEVVRAARARGLSLPVLMLTARDTPSDRIRGLDAGCDDYLVKPFDFDELLARVRALLRRSEGATSGEQVLEVGELTIDLPHRVVTAAGNEVHLTPTEFDLLKELALAEGRPLTHQMLLRKVWGPGYAQEMQLLRTHMGRLRDKLEENGVPRRSIETLTGVGYRLRG